MKRLLKSLMAICLVMVLSINVDAVCNDTELNDFVEKLKIEFMYPEVQSEYAYYFTLSEDKYKGEGIEKILYLEALDGAGIPGEWKYQDTIKRYGVGGYTNLKEETYTLNVKAIAGKCEGETLKHELYTIPQFNRYIQTSYCEKYPEYDLCKRFTNETNGMSDNEFATKMKEHEREIKNENTNKFLSLVMKYYSYILCVIVPVVIISIYFNMKINRFKKLRNREETRYSNNKKGLFLFILFFVMLAHVNAASNCEVRVKETRTSKWIPDTQVSVYHTIYDGEVPDPANTYYEPVETSDDGSGEPYTLDHNEYEETYNLLDDNGDPTYSLDSGEKFEGTDDEFYESAQAIESYAAAETNSELESEDGEGNKTTKKLQYKRCVTIEKGGQSQLIATETATATSAPRPPSHCCISETCACSDGGESDPHNCCCGGWYCPCVSECSETKPDNCDNTRSQTVTNSFKGSGDFGANNACDNGLIDTVMKACQCGGEYTCTPSKHASQQIQCGSHAGSGGWNPVVPSIPVYRIVEETNETWKLDEDVDYEVYCVNPDAPMTGGYQSEYVQPSNCASSNSSVDCGYLNILVEAQYNNMYSGTDINEDAVSLATRFWGAYTGQGGFSGVGMGYHVSVVDSDTECTYDEGNWGDYHGSQAGKAFASCYDMDYLGTKGDESTGYLNIYTATVKFILSPENIVRYGSGAILNGNVINTKVEDALDTFKSLECEASPGVWNAGVICGESPQLKYAIALFYNTKQGNPDFQTHLNKLYGGLTTEPVNVALSSETVFKVDCSKVNDKTMDELATDAEKNLKAYCDKYGKFETEERRSSTLSIDFKEEITHDASLYDCSYVKNEIGLNSANYTKDELEQLERINEFCNIEVKNIRVEIGSDIYEYEPTRYRVCPNGNCDGVSWIIDSEKSTIGVTTACQKSTCYVNTKVYAPCGADIKRVITTLSYEQSKSNYSIKRYTACGGLGTQTVRVNNYVGSVEPQFLYSIFSQDHVDTTETKEVEKEFNVELNCTYPCKPKPQKSRLNCEEPKYKDFVTSDASELEYSNRDELYKGTFKRNVDTNNSTYGKSFESSIKDPSLSCILNSSPTDKTLYDYSSYFGVNEDICRVFCSDEVLYYMAEKTLVYSGLSFTYDIEYGTFQRNSTDKQLSSIIQMRRNCVSEIYYDNLTFSSHQKEINTFANRYGIKIDETAGIDNWKQLYEKVYDNAINKENKRNDMIYIIVIW